MTRFLKTMLRAGLLALALAMAGTAQAVIIDFGGLPGSNGDAFTGPYSEDGFIVTSDIGQAFEGHVFGNPRPSLVVGSVFGGGSLAAFEVVRSGGGTFIFNSFDVIGNNGPARWFFSGSLGGVDALGGSHDGFTPNRVWTTINGGVTLIDTLRLVLVAAGDTTSANLDNINLTVPEGSVPEPATWALMILGFGLVGGAMRKSKQRVRVTYA